MLHVPRLLGGRIAYVHLALNLVISLTFAPRPLLLLSFSLNNMLGLSMGGGSFLFPSLIFSLHVS